MINPGETFFGLDRGGHLWIALSLPDREGRISAVNITTHRPRTRNHSATCLLLHDYDHPYVEHVSCIAYRLAEHQPVWEIESGQHGSKPVFHQPCSPQLLRRIQEGALDSPLTPSAVRRAVASTLRET